MVASGVGPGEHGEKSGIWIINLLAATPRQILGNAEGAVPSPDGTLIAFRSSNRPEIAVIDSDGENLRAIATAGINENFGQLQWSPDGKQVGAIVRRIGDPEGSIEAFDLNGGRKEIARVPRPRSFVWLGDGRMIVSSVEADGSSSPVLHDIDAHGRQATIPIGAGNTVAQISATSDGKRLVLVRESEQSDAYVGTVGKSGVSEVQRLTLNDRDDIPTGWLRDSRSILFSSNRNGTLDIFRQALDSPTAEQLASGPDQQFGAEVTPDGKNILYWSTSENVGEMRLMSMPNAGGPADLLLEAPQGSSFHCATAAATCLLATLKNSTLELSSFDGHSAHLTPVRTVPVKFDTAAALWAVAPDASRLAWADSAGLNVIELSSGQTSTVAASEFSGRLAGVASGGNATSWLVTANSTRSNQVLLVSGSAVRQLYASQRPLSSPALSPDGKHLLFGVTSASSNAWLFENF